MEIPPTERLYSEDARTLDFAAEVLRCEELPGGRWAVVLDRTFFYPESGGQAADAGRIGSATVLDVREEGGSVLHVVGEPLPLGPVQCHVDGAVRFDHMQQHSGQHLLSKALLEVAGAQTVSFHMGEESCTIDLDAERLDDDALRAAEELANRIVMENRPVGTREVSATDVNGPLRKAVPPGVETVRLVEIEDFDLCPCCGTHVSATGEIGPIKILKTERVKGRSRVHFKAGKRAVEDYMKKHEIIARIADRFTTGIEGVPARVEKLSAENKSLKKQVKRLGALLMERERARLLELSRPVGNARIIEAVLEGVDRGLLKSLAASFRNEKRTVVLLGNDEGTVVCNASGDLDLDLAAAVLACAERRGGRGGGSGSFAEANLPRKEHTREFIEEVIRNVTEKT